MKTKKQIKICAFLLTCVLLFSSLIFIPVTAIDEVVEVTEDRTCKYVAPGTITLDGEMGEDEGWAEKPYLILNRAVERDDDPNIDFVDVEFALTSYPEVRYCTDGEYLYAFCNWGKTGDYNRYYFQFSFGGHNNKASAADAGLFLEIFGRTNDADRASDGKMTVRLTTGGTGSNGLLATYEAGKKLHPEAAPDFAEKTKVYMNEAKTALEIAVPIPSSAKGHQFAMHVGATTYHTSNTNPYAVPSEGYAWNSALIELTLPVVDDPTCKLVAPGSITLDGEMGEDEGWAAIPYMFLNRSIDANNGLGDVDVVLPSCPEVRYCTDGEYLYAHCSFKAGDYNYFYFQFSFGGLNNKLNADDADRFLEVRVTDTKFEECIGGGTPVYRLTTGRIVQGKDNDITDDTNYELQATELYINKDKNGLELKVPIPSVVKGHEIEMHVNAMAKNDDKLSEGVKGENRVAATSSDGFDWNHANVKLTLPGKRPVVVGCQTADGDNGTYRVRFSAVMNSGNNDLAKMGAGFEIKYVDGPNKDYNGKAATAVCKHVYTSLLANGETVKPEQYGGEYFFCFTIDGLERGQTYTFEVACYITLADGVTTVTSSDSITVTLPMTE